MNCNCPVCKSKKIFESIDTYFSSTKTGYVIIENVPCMKCEQCGEVLFSASVIEKIEEFIENLDKILSKIFILDYSSVA